MMSSVYTLGRAQVEFVTQVGLSRFSFRIFVIILHDALRLTVKNNCKLPSAEKVQLPGFSVDHIVGGVGSAVC